MSIDAPLIIISLAIILITFRGLIRFAKWQCVDSRIQSLENTFWGFSMLLLLFGLLPYSPEPGAYDADDVGIYFAWHVVILGIIAFGVLALAVLKRLTRQQYEPARGASGRWIAGVAVALVFGNLFVALRAVL